MITLRIRKKAVIIIFISIVFCLLNRSFNHLTTGYIHWILSCYFNDLFGVVAFSAYCVIVSDNVQLTKYKIDKL